MSQPPKSPPSKSLEGQDRDKPGIGEHAGHAAEQEETARTDSKAKPSGTRR